MSVSALAVDADWNDQLFKAYMRASGRSFLEARTHVAELFKFMALVKQAGADKTRALAPSPVCASVWRVAILFTRQYADFCAQLVGFFVHHRPEAADEPELERTRYRDTHMLYLLLFGHPSPDLWPPPASPHALGKHADFVRSRSGYNSVVAEFKGAPIAAAAAVVHTASSYHSHAAVAATPLPVAAPSSSSSQKKRSHAGSGDSKRSRITIRAAVANKNGPLTRRKLATISDVQPASPRPKQPPARTQPISAESSLESSASDASISIDPSQIIELDSVQQNQVFGGGRAHARDDSDVGDIHDEPVAAAAAAASAAADDNDDDDDGDEDDDAAAAAATAAADAAHATTDDNSNVATESTADHVDEADVDNRADAAEAVGVEAEAGAADLGITADDVGAFFDAVDVDVNQSGGGGASSAAAAAATSDETPFPITIKTLAGKEFRVSVSDGMTVYETKQMLLRQEKIPLSTNQVRFVFGERQLEDPQTMLEAGVSEDAVVFFVLRL